MRILFSLGLLFLSFAASAQIIEAGKGIGAIKIGTPYEEVRSILGYDGLRLTPEQYEKQELYQIKKEEVLEFFLGFDYAVEYNYVMTVPVTMLFFKDDKVSYIVVSSYPEYNQAICEDLETEKGLYFWDHIDYMEEIYGTNYTSSDYKNVVSDHYYYLQEGASFSFRRKRMRAVSIFEPLTPEKAETFKENLKKSFLEKVVDQTNKL